MPYEQAVRDWERPIACFDCGNEYAFVGSGTHPGVCPECGGRAVSYAGRVRVATIQTNDRFADEDAPTQTVNVVAEDDTNRELVFVFSVDRESSTTIVVSVRLGPARLTPDAASWSPELVPDAVVSAIEAVGLEFVPPARNDGGAAP